MVVVRLDDVQSPNAPAIVPEVGTHGKASICQREPEPFEPVVREIPGPQLVYLNNVLAALVPPTVVTKTLAVPAACSAVVAVRDVSDNTVTLVAAAPPQTNGRCTGETATC